MDELQDFYFVSEGINFHLRPIKSTDKVLLQKGYQELSEWSKYMRFFANRSQLNENQLNFFTEVDGINHVAWILLDESETEFKLAGVGRFVKIPESHEMAEVAVTVVDSYQKKGLGRLLFSLINILAGRSDLQKLRHYVLPENQTVMKILHHYEIINQIKGVSEYVVDTKVIKQRNYISLRQEIQDLIAQTKNH